MPPSLTSVSKSFHEAWLQRLPPPPRWAEVTIAISGVILVLAVSAGEFASESGPPTWWLATDLVVGLLGALALPLMLRRPLIAAVLFVVLSTVSPPMTPLVGTALLWLAQHTELRVSLPVGMAAVAAQAIRGLWRHDGVLDWWLVAVIAGFAAAVGWGAWSRTRRQMIEGLVERTRQAERELIAREMHDVLAHRLSLLATYAGAVEYNRGAPADELVEAAKVIRGEAHHALDDLRQVIDVLRSDDGDASDADTSPPQPTLANLPGLVEESRRTGTPVTLNLLSDGSSTSVLPVVGRTAYRVVQEALTNARKHAPGRPVQVAISGGPGETLNIEVRNPIDGEDAGGAIPRGGSGLVGMGERVRLAGGELEFGATSSGEFRVSARLPWPR